MEVVGYKCFEKGLKNRYSKEFFIGKIYLTPGIIKFRENGFHMCKNMEDIFRYFNALDKEVDVCLVRGSGHIDTYNDEYAGYYDMYCVEKLEILKKLTRDEIINKALTLNELRAIRFVSSFKLTLEEIEIFKSRFKNKIDVMDAIKYYQENDKTIYQRKYIK